MLFPTLYQVRAEVSLLHRLKHPYVIDFIGVVLQPLCFILEWAPGGSLDSVLHKYRKLDARVAPRALQKTAHQVGVALCAGGGVWVVVAGRELFGMLIISVTGGF